MKLWYLVSTLAAVYCRPQNTPQNFGVEKTGSEGVEQPVKVTILSYYGGAKGQSLKITETKDGRVMMSIIKTPKNTTTSVTTTTTTTTTESSVYEFPPLPSRHEFEYDTNLRKVHETAFNIIKLQETAKKQGKLTDEEQIAYNENINALNLSAQNLARYEEEYDDSFENDQKADLSSWLDKRKNNKKDVDKKKEQINKNKEEGLMKEEENGKDDEETVGVDAPPDDASVAEAKPVGLAVAGEGGVAASKPIATAVVGPKGLAVARPVGTAIAGVSPDQALVPIYAEGYLAAKPGRGGDRKNATTSELLNRIINKYHQH